MSFRAERPFLSFRAERLFLVILNEVKNLEDILVNVFVYVTEILPPFGRLNDISFLFY